MATTTDREPELAAAMILFVVLSLIAFSLRIMTRSMISKSLGREDILLAIALVLFLVFCSLYLTQVHDGLIRHIDTLRPEQIVEALKLIYAGELLYTASATVLQISIAIILLRITSSKRIRGVIWTVIILCITIGITLFAMIAFQCQPVSYVWDHNLPGGHCMKPNVRTGAAYAYAAVSCLSNWTLGILPWIICRHLTNRRQRYEVAGLLCFANFGSIATAIRFYAIHQLLETEDFFLSSVPLATWSAVEVGTGIVAVSVSALYPLQQRIRGKRRSTYDGMTVVVPEINSLELATKDSQ